MQRLCFKHLVRGLWCVLPILALLASGCHRNADGVSKPRSAGEPPKLVVPTRGAYTGAYIDWGEEEDAVSLEGIEEFESQVGKHQAIIAFSSYWGEQAFPQEAVNVVVRHGSIPLVYWSPWDWPYREEEIESHGPDKFNLPNILAGQWDKYIDQWADAAKAVGSPMFVSLCNEANGDWFPWSGTFYGGGKPIIGTDPVRYEGPELFKKAYRYIVDRVRARGASNVLWVLHLNNFPEPYEAWNSMAQYYPGSDYVDWLGLSVYGELAPDDKRWESFEDMIELPYNEITKLDPDKPFMVTEWGVGEFPHHGDKGRWLAAAFEQMTTHFPRLHAAVYWHERWQNNKTMLYSNLRVNSSPAALEAYRRGVASSFWLGEPVFR